MQPLPLPAGFAVRPETMAEHEHTEDVETLDELDARPGSASHERNTPRARAITKLVVAGCMALALAVHGRVTARRVARTYAADAPVLPTPPPEPSLRIDEVEALHDAFTREDFTTLDLRLAWDGREARHDPGYELRYRVALDIFDRDDPSVRRALDLWVAQAPMSPAARLARATHFTARAWTARGHAVTSKTTRDRFREMDEWFGLAAADIAAARRLDSTNVMSYWLQLGLIPGGDVDERAVLEQGLRQLPGSLLPRTRVQHYRRPRWSSGRWRSARVEMLAFADESDEASISNPRVHVIRGYIPFDSAEFLHHRDLELEAVEMYSRALRHGDFWVFRLGRADAYFYSKQWSKAKDDYDAVLVERPTATEARARRAATCMRLFWKVPLGAERNAMMQCMLEDIRIASTLDPGNPDLAWILKQHPYLERFVVIPPAG